MHNSPEQNTGDNVADFVLPEGCVSCGGSVTIRTTPGQGSHGYCPQCHWLSRTRLRMHRQGLEIAFATQGAA